MSPNYASELVSGPEKGVELHTYLRDANVEGVVNGMDVKEWDPATDKHLPKKYDQVWASVGQQVWEQGVCWHCLCKERDLATCRAAATILEGMNRCGLIWGL